MRNEPRHVVLVAEDHPVNQKVIGLLLDMLDVENTVVCNGREAVAAAQPGRYALILMDLMMPVMDGFQAAFEIRKNEFGSARHIPIIACTAIDRKLVQEQCVHAGIDDYIGKPISREILKKKIERWSRIPVSMEAVTPEVETALKRLSGRSSDPVTVGSIDQNVLNLMYGISQLDDILALFLTVTTVLMAQLASAIEHKDLAKLQRMTNEIKGSSYAVSATEMAGLCRNLERQGEEQDWPEVARTYAALGLAFARVRKFLESNQQEIRDRRIS